MLSIRKLVFRTGMCMVLVAFGAALDVDDDPRPSDLEEDMLYHEYNYIDTGPMMSQSRGDPVRDLMTYKLLKSLQSRDQAQLRILDRPKLADIFDSLENEQVSWRKNHADVDSDLQSMVKRPADAIGTALNINKVKPAIRQQQKWKSKKGKVGSQLVCYFKLCAFRAPS